MFARRGARSVGLWTCVSATALAVFATTAHGQSQIQEEQLPDLCSGAYYNRAAYIVRFDVQTNTFSRPATDPLESEEIVLCMDGTPDPLVTYSIEYAEQSDGTTPTAQTVSVGAAPSRFQDSRAASSPSSTTVKCRTCDALAQVHAAVDAEIGRTVRILSSLGADDGDAAHVLESLAERGPCACMSGDTCAARGTYCEDPTAWHASAWVNHELRRVNAGLLLVDGQWLAQPRRPPTSDPNPAQGVTNVRDKLDDSSDGAVAFQQRFNPFRQPIAAQARNRVEFQVAPGSDSVLELFGRPEGSSDEREWELVGVNDDLQPSSLGSRIDFAGRDGWEYHVVVSSYWADRPLSGSLRLSHPDEIARTPIESVDDAPAIDRLKVAVGQQLATYDRLRSLAANLHATRTHHRAAYRVGSYPGNRLLVLRAREHRSSLRLSDEGTSLAHTVETTPHSISITIKSTSWFSLNAGMVVSGLPRHTFRARQASETQSVLVRDIADWSVDPVFFATIHWCAQDLSRPIYARRCAGYAPTPHDVVDPADVPLGTGRFNHLSPEAERLRRRERLRRWTPGFAIGVPLSREAFDFNLMFGLSLPYIPYVSIITGVQLARVTRVREGIGLAPASGSVGDATTFGVGENAVDAGTHERLIPGWFIAITLTDEIFRALFPSLEAASK